MLHRGSFWAEKGVIRGRIGAIFGGVLWAKIASKSTARPKKISMLGLPPQTPLPNSEQLACPELHTGAHQRNLAFEMPGNRNGATDRGGSKHCDDYSRALGWRGCFFKQLTVHDELQQDIEKEMQAGVDCLKNEDPVRAKRAFGKVLAMTSPRVNSAAHFNAKVPSPPHPTPPHPACRVCAARRR